MNPIAMHSKKRKIYYVPGMFSLIILPFVFIHFVQLPVSQTVIKMFVPSDERPKNDVIEKFTNAYVLRAIKNKKKLSIDLDYDHELNKQKLSLIQTDVQRLEYYNDTATVIIVNFSDQVEYSEFVQLVNILFKSRIRRYAWVGDSMIILGSAKY